MFLLSAVALLSLAFPSPATVDWHKSFSLNGRPEIQVASTNVDVRVYASDRKDIEAVLYADRTISSDAVGICGAAASSGKTIVVDDVKSDPRYLACSAETKSEIVAPLFVRGKVAGELDIDSHFPAAFGLEDVQLVEHCAALVGECIEKLGDSHATGQAQRGMMSRSGR